MTVPRYFIIGAALSFASRLLSYVFQWMGYKEVAIIIDYYGAGMFVSGLISGWLFIKSISYMPVYPQVWKISATAALVGGVPLDFLVILLFGGYWVHVFITAFLCAAFGGAGGMGSLLLYRRNARMRNFYPSTQTKVSKFGKK